MNLKQAQDALAQLLQADVFNYHPDIATVTPEEREKLLAATDIQPYELGYQLGPINYLEKLKIDYDESGKNVEMLRCETTWEYNGRRAFELEITEIPKSIILLGEELQQPKILITTWWTDLSGHVISYYVKFNGEELERVES